MSLLKEEAKQNMPPISVTPETSQVPISLLKEDKAAGTMMDVKLGGRMEYQ